MKKAILILSLLILCAFNGSAQSSNQWVGWKDISPKIPGTFTQVNPEFMSATNRFLRKDSSLAYLAIYDDWHSNLTNKANNQLVAYGDLVPISPTGCAFTWDSLTLDQTLNASQVGYFDAGTVSNTFTCTYTNLSVSGNGYGRVNVYYGNQLLARSTYSNTSGSFTVPYTYNSNYGHYVTVKIDSAGLHPQPWYNISMSCYAPSTVYIYAHWNTGQLLIDCYDAAGGTGNIVNLNCSASGTITYTGSGPGSYSWSIAAGSSGWSQSGVTGITSINSFSGTPMSCGAGHTYNYSHQ